jgi:hypothetical protein
MGCTSVQRTEQVLEAMDWYFGGRECRTTTFQDDTSGDQGGLYFDLNTFDENYAEVKYLVWLDDGVASAPSPAADQTLLPVSYSQDDDAATIAAAYKAAVEAVAEVKVEVTGGAAETENNFLGDITDESYSGAGSITLTVNKAGFGGSIGAIAQGGGSLASEQSLEDILSDQTGDIILDQVMKGAAVSLDITLAEMTTANWENLVGEGYGDTETVGADNLTGYGTSKLYNSAFDFAGQLVGHPIRLGNDDRSADICIWKCVGNLNSINYSGSEVQGGEFSFTALKDDTKPESINLFARGDHSLV